MSEGRETTGRWLIGLGRADYYRHRFHYLTGHDWVRTTNRELATVFNTREAAEAMAAHLWAFDARVVEWK